jgi:Cys-tRNA synthase (O-phospho-L-seryl-tRNA:Cys-tRNA synthase)
MEHELSRFVESADWTRGVVPREGTRYYKKKEKKTLWLAHRKCTSRGNEQQKVRRGEKRASFTIEKKRKRRAFFYYGEQKERVFIGS